MKTINLIIGTAAILVLTGCSTTTLTLNRVGPAPPQASKVQPQGYLRVSTATDTVPLGDSTFYYPHTGYYIYQPDGKLVQWVENHIGPMDQSPSLVSLPEGSYLVKAESDSYGWVNVPVVIRWGKTTEVNLESWGERKPDKANDAALVRLPNGYVVGWRANNDDSIAGSSKPAAEK